MNPLFELVSVSEKPKEEGTYKVLQPSGHFIENIYNPKEFGMQNGGWLVYNNPSSKYLRPYTPPDIMDSLPMMEAANKLFSKQLSQTPTTLHSTPPASAEEAAKEYCSKYCDVIFHAPKDMVAYCAFLSGHNSGHAHAAAEVKELREGLEKIVAERYESDDPFNKVENMFNIASDLLNKYKK